MLSGKQKAAMLLMSLDSASAAELLKGVDPQVVEELAVELAYLDASGNNEAQRVQVAHEFYSRLQNKGGFDCKNFLKEMLKNSVGNEKASRIENEIDSLLERRDPFLAVKSAEAQTISRILKREHPKAIAVVLSELSPRKSSEVLNHLGEEVRMSVVSRMTSSESVSSEAKLRIGQMLTKRLKKLAQAKGESGSSGQDESLRKVAVILRNLAKEVRDGMMRKIRDKDKESAEQVMKLMVLWEDILLITDRSLQNALRNAETKTLALGLMNADEKIVSKIKSNISERAAETLQEETSLMSSPSKAEIQKARDELVEMLREINEKGELQFIEED